VLATGGRDGLVLCFALDRWADGMPRVALPVCLANVDDDDVVEVMWAGRNALVTAYLSGAVRKWEVPAGELD
jgi:hypothetical protein